MTHGSSNGGIEAALRVAEQDERDIAVALRTIDARLNDEVTRLEVIERYVREYEAPAETPNAGPQALRNARSFIAQLGQTVTGQRSVIERLRRDAEQTRARWVSARLRREAMEKLIAQRADEELRHREKREQQRIDDRSAAVATPQRGL
jgi:flagellar export protein FliJ